jgi:hypothetical protein
MEITGFGLVNSISVGENSSETSLGGSQELSLAATTEGFNNKSEIKAIENFNFIYDYASKIISDVTVV